MLIEFVGEIIHGKGFGRTLGFPTANLSISYAPDLRYGVYAASVFVHCEWYDSLVNVGKHPTVPEGPLSIEVHILGQFGDLYGEKVTVRLLRFIREEFKFTSVETLREQIQKDLASLRGNTSQ